MGINNLSKVSLKECSETLSDFDNAYMSEQNFFRDDPEKPELFASLARIYSEKNKKQQLICLYQALYYAKKRNETSLAESIDKSIKELLSEGVSVPETSFIILSYNTIDYTRQCLDSIKDNVSLDRCQVVVVDNASEDGSLEYLKTLDWITLVENHENRGFPGGCNDGIAVSEKDNDIYLLNSDTILLPNSLFWLKMGLYENESVGSTGSMSNYAGGGQMVQRDWTSTDDIIDFGTKNNVPMQYPYEYKMFLIGFSLLLKRRALDETGLLDERFNPGNSEDLDICFRILKSGRVNLLCHNSFVVHFGNKSFEQLKKKGFDYGKVLNKNDKKLQDKMKIDIWNCLNSVKKVALSQIKRDRSSAFNILELGCDMGSTASLIRTIYPNAEYTGIEADKEEASYAAAFGTIIAGNPKKIDCSKVFDREQFDYIIYSSKTDSETIENKYKPYLKSDGQIVNDSAKPVLSISMLCNGKHKKETIKCLRSLMTIKNRLHSELVIVDTGCDEEMHKLISDYADKVVEFKWCDDFAKARNAGLKECTGEWFMYIDDDEWFEDTAPLVEFFTSGDYKNYKQGGYRVRNYLDSDGKNYEDFWAGRMTERSDKTHFVGIIHEYMDPLGGACKLVDCFAHHYGYVYKSEKDHYAKAYRNIKPLRKMIKEEPNNLHWYSQLAQEYYAIGEKGELANLCDYVLKNIDKIDDALVNLARIDFYYGRLCADNQMFLYDQTIEDFNKFRKDKRNSSVGEASLYFASISAFYEKKDYENIIRYGKKYIEIYDRFMTYDNPAERIHSETSLMNVSIFAKNNIWTVMSFLIGAGIKMHEADELHKYFYRLSEIKNNGDQYMLIYDKLAEAFADLPFDKRFVEYADTMLSNGTATKNCMIQARLIEEDDKKKKGNRFDNLIKVYGQTNNGKSSYLTYMKLRYAAMSDGSDEEIYGLMKKLILDKSDFFALDKSVWDIAIEKRMDLAPIFSEISFAKWYKEAGIEFEKNDWKDTEPVRKMMERYSDNNDIRFRFFRLKEMEYKLINDKSDELERYCRECVDFYREIFNDRQFSESFSSTLIPLQCQFAVEFIKADGNVEKIQKCHDIYEPFNSVLDKYIIEQKSTYVFVIYSAASWVTFENLWKAVKCDNEINPFVLVLPYYDKNEDGSLGAFHNEWEQLPDDVDIKYFADVDLSKVKPDVIFINSQMDENNPTAAVPAEYYASRLQDSARMLIYIPVVLNESAAENTLSQIKEQLKKM